jgi:hypothetical protein
MVAINLRHEGDGLRRPLLAFGAGENRFDLRGGKPPLSLRGEGPVSEGSCSGKWLAAAGLIAGFFEPETDLLFYGKAARGRVREL